MLLKIPPLLALKSHSEKVLRNFLTLPVIRKLVCWEDGAELSEMVTLRQAYVGRVRMGPQGIRRGQETSQVQQAA